MLSVLIPITDVPTARTEPVDTLTSITRPSIGLAISVFRPSSPASCSICRRASLRRNRNSCTISRALRLQIELLRFHLQDLVLRIFLSLLRIRKLTAPVFDIATRRYPLCQKALEVFNLRREVLDALVCRSNDLLERRLELGKILDLGGQLSLDSGIKIGMFTLALAIYFYGVAMALLGIGLGNSRYELALRNVIADGYFDRREPAGRG